MLSQLAYSSSTFSREGYDMKRDLVHSGLLLAVSGALGLPSCADDEAADGVGTGGRANLGSGGALTTGGAGTGGAGTGARANPGSGGTLSTGGATGSTCDSTNPAGRTCSDAANCEVECDCGDGLFVTIGQCTNGTCADVVGQCDDACSQSGGESMGYCFVGEAPASGSGGNGSQTSGGAASGEDCTDHGDCESNVCFRAEGNQQGYCTATCSSADSTGDAECQQKDGMEDWECWLATHAEDGEAPYCVPPQ